MYPYIYTYIHIHVYLYIFFYHIYYIYICICISTYCPPTLLITSDVCSFKTEKDTYPATNTARNNVHSPTLPGAYPKQQTPNHQPYRGTSLIKHPTPGPCSRPMPRVLMWA